MINSKDLLKGSVKLLGASIVARGSSMLFRYFAATNLTADSYGQLSLYISLFLSMASLASFGICPSLAKLAANTKDSAVTTQEYYDNSLAMVCTTSLIASILFLFLVKNTPGAMFTTTVILATAVGLLCWSYFQVSIGFSLARLKFGTASFYEASDGASNIILLLICALFLSKLTLSTYVFVYSLSYLALAVIAIQINISSLHINALALPFRNVNIKLIKDIFGHTFSLMIITFTSTFFGYMLRLYLSKNSNYDVAQFDIALVFYSVPRMLFTSLVRPVVPYASQNSHAKIKIPALKRFVQLFILSIFILYMLYHFKIIDCLLRLIKLSDYLPSFPIFMVIMIGSIFDLLFGYMSSYLQGYGKINIVAIISLATFLLLILPSYFLVHSYKAYGAAICSVLFITITSLLSIAYAHKRIGLELS